MNLASLDLNLLVTLDALLQHRSVTRAAQQVGLSQPAMSAQLARLRRHFDDEILARVGNSYRLTPLAVRLKERCRVALSGAERVFDTQPAFEPATSVREFSVLISDYGVVVLGADIAALLTSEAPGVRLRFVPNVPQLVDRAQLALVNYDLLVLPHGFVEGLPYEDLYRDEWTCLVADGNDAVGDTITREQMQTLPWVLSYLGPTASTPAARQIRMLGIEPRAQVVTENFLAVPALVSGTNRIALLQRRLADRIPDGLGVRALPLPFETTPLVQAMWWHPMNEQDPDNEYLRGVVRRAAACAADRRLPGWPAAAAP